MVDRPLVVEPIDCPRSEPLSHVCVIYCMATFIGGKKCKGRKIKITFDDFGQVLSPIVCVFSPSLELFLTCKQGRSFRIGDH